MNPIKRIAISLNANLEQFVDQVENHEALAASALREIEGAAARARGQHRRIELEVDRMERRIEELRAQKELWTARARKAASEDQNEKEALECIRRMKDAERGIERLSAQHAEQSTLRDRLASDLQRVDVRVSELRLQRSSLASRQAQAEAAAAIREADSGAIGELGGIFDRWESRIAGEGGLAPTEHDPLERKYAREEEEADLRQALSEIVQTGK